MSQSTFMHLVESGLSGVPPDAGNNCTQRVAGTIFKLALDASHRTLLVLGTVGLSITSSSFAKPF